MKHDIYNLMLFDYLNIIRTADYSIVGSKEDFDKIEEAIQDEIGTSDKAEAIRQKRKELAIMMCDITVEQNQKLLTKFQIESDRLKKLLEDTEESDIYDLIVYLEKSMGFQINQKETSLKMFITYIKHDKDGRKSNKQ